MATEEEMRTEAMFDRFAEAVRRAKTEDGLGPAFWAMEVLKSIIDGLPPEQSEELLDGLPPMAREALRVLDRGQAGERLTRRMQSTRHSNEPRCRNCRGTRRHNLRLGGLPPRLADRDRRHGRRPDLRHHGHPQQRRGSAARLLSPV